MQSLINEYAEYLFFAHYVLIAGLVLSLIRETYKLSKK